jgi:branched-chain amino acid transport system substrate-binding protein
MKLRSLIDRALVASTLGARSAPRLALRPGQGAVLPAAVYRTGPYAPNGTPWANGKQDYIKMINAATAASTA